MTYQPEESDVTAEVGDSLLQNNLEKKMNNGILTLSWGNVRSAIVTAFVTAIFGIAGYIVGLGDVFKIDFHSLVNVAVLSSLTAIISLFKNYFTTNEGRFLGAVDTNP